MKKRLAAVVLVLIMLVTAGCENSRISCHEPPKTPEPSAQVEKTESEPEKEVFVPPADVPDDEFVRIKDYIPDSVIDLKYSTADNFTGSVVYDFSDAYLRYGTVKKLINVQNELKKSGMVLKIWDAFRPVSAQFRLWEICPNPIYVANPNNGYSSHSRGNTIDVTVVYSNGTEVEMPSGFDDFTHLADRDYSDCSEIAAKNAELLEYIMVNNGFKPYSGEWWHYSDNTKYEVEDAFVPT